MLFSSLLTSFVSLSAVSALPAKSAPHKVTILHTNDIHAHLDEFNSGGIDCRQKDRDANLCVGGIARMKTVVDAYRKNTSDVLLFDAGDIFQGTLFFNVYGGWPGAKLMNELKYDAMTIGNHEFDRGVPYLASFFRNLSFPVVSSNIDFQTAPQLRDVGVKPYVILEKYNLGVIGFITPTTAYISNTAKNITFNDPVQIVQGYVDELHAKGIKRIICVSHNGYFDDLNVAAKTHGINLIVGGHSHSLLLKNSTAAPDVVGTYPTPVTNLDKKTTWIVQAHRYGDYMGHLDLEWDETDELASLKGEPIRLDNTIAQDPTIQAQVNEWRQGFSGLVTTVLTNSTGPYNNTFCKSGNDCPMGDLIADCLMEIEANNGGDFALINGGGIRAAFPAGPITVGDIMTVLPFDNAVSRSNFTGSEILSILEHAAAPGEKIDFAKPIVSFAQFSKEFRWKYSKSAPVGHRVKDVQINGKPLNPSKTYTIVSNDFVAGGGDAILPVKPFIPGGFSMSDIVIQCLRKHETISPNSDPRTIELD